MSDTSKHSKSEPLDAYYPGQADDVLERLARAAVANPVAIEDLVYAAERLAAISAHGARSGEIIDRWLMSQYGMITASRLLDCKHTDMFHNLYADAWQCRHCARQFESLDQVMQNERQ